MNQRGEVNGFKGVSLLTGKKKKFIHESLDALRSSEHCGQAGFLLVFLLDLLIHPLGISFDGAKSVSDFMGQHCCHLANKSEPVTLFQFFPESKVPGKDPFEENPHGPKENQDYADGPPHPLGTGNNAVCRRGVEDHAK